jgi:hypothetical protein
MISITHHHAYLDRACEREAFFVVVIMIVIENINHAEYYFDSLIHRSSE